MSNESTVLLKTIKPNSIIKIEVSGEYYSRIQRLFFWLTQKDQEKAMKTIEELKKRDPIDEYEQNFLTLLTLIYEIENKASEQGFLEDKEFPRLNS